MKSMFCSDEGFFTRGFTRKFQRPFYGFSSRVAEKHSVHSRKVDEVLRKKSLLLSVIKIGNMYQLLYLLFYRINNCGMAVSHIIYRYPGYAIYVLFSIDIYYHRSPRRFYCNRLA